MNFSAGLRSVCAENSNKLQFESIFCLTLEISLCPLSRIERGVADEFFGGLDVSLLREFQYLA